MLENRTVLGVCVFVLLCQIVIWRAYTVINSNNVYDLDGIITDPTDGIRSPKCWKHVAGNATTANSIMGILTQNGGHFKPSLCEPRATIAIIVPYRDREAHLKKFLGYIHPFLQRQVIEYVIYVVEPAMPTTFNRGLLANIGVLEAKRSGFNFTCYIIHDVDLLPADESNLYVCSDAPRHMSTSNSNYEFRQPYSGYVGGVISFPPLSYEKINGFSNMYFGWGGEDDDLRYRISEAGYKLQRVPEDIGIYDAMEHGEDKHNKANSMKYDLMEGSRIRMKYDGLNSVKYRLLKVEKRPLYTWLFVQVNQSDYAFDTTTPT